MAEFSPTAWRAMCMYDHHESFRINSSLCDSNKRNQTGEIVGGEDKIDTKREYFAGDNFIVNFGNEYWKTVSWTRKWVAIT